MLKPRTFILRYFRWIFPVLAGIFIATAIAMTDREQAIQTDHAPRGIISLELSFDKAGADSIRNEWIKDSVYRGRAECNCSDTSIASHIYPSRPRARSRKDIALNNIRFDYVFILFYGLLLITLLIRTDTLTKETPFLRPAFTSLPRLKGITKVLIAATIIAMALDAVENYAMARFLVHYDIAYPLSFSIPATIKFIILALCVMYVLVQFWKKGVFVHFISDITATVEKIFETIWNFRLVVAGLIIVYLVMWVMDQGQDLLLNINTRPIGPILLYVSVTSLALLSWHLPKYLTCYKPREKSHIGLKDLFRHAFIQPSRRQRNTSRLLGAVTFLIPAFGILNALDKFRVPYFFDFLSPSTLLLLVYLLYLVGLRNDLIKRAYSALGPRLQVPVAVSIFVVLLGIVTWFGFDGRNEHPSFLANLSLGLIFLSFLFLIYTSLRRRWLLQFHRTAKAQGKTSWFQVFDSLVPKLVMWTGLALATLFLTVNFTPLNSTILGRYSTLPIVVCGIIFYTIFFGWLIFTGRRYKINLAGLAIAVIFLAALLVNSPFHDVRTIKPEQKTAQVSLDHYFARWLVAREKEIDSCRRREFKYPVFLVNTYGGGIRAAAWTSMQMAYLDQVMVSQQKMPFQHYVFSYSGASGGTIGAAVLCALRHRSTDPQTYSLNKVEAFYRNDFLTPVLIGLQGRDLFFSTFFFIHGKDRATLQENVWESHLSEMKVKFDGPYNSLWDTAGSRFEVPLLFSNTYNIDLGRKGIVSPVQLPQSGFPGSILVNELARDKQLPLSTGAFLSARFPYISPAGRFENNYHFLDGGLKENSGAETSLEVHNAIVNAMSLPATDSLGIKAGNLLQHVRFYFLSLNNTVNFIDPAVDKKNVFEVMAPVTGLINNYVGTSDRADMILQNKVPRVYFTLRPKNNYICNDRQNGFQPILPLGWQISDQALRRMKESISYHNKDAKDLLHRIFGIEVAKITPPQ